MWEVLRLFCYEMSNGNSELQCYRGSPAVSCLQDPPHNFTVKGEGGAT